MEQLDKVKSGLLPGQYSLDKPYLTPADQLPDGTYPDSKEFDVSHAAAIEAENKVNGNERYELPDGSNIFREKNGTATTQVLTPTANGGVSVNKTNDCPNIDPNTDNTGCF